MGEDDSATYQKTYPSQFHLDLKRLVLAHEGGRVDVEEAQLDEGEEDSQPIWNQDENVVGE